MAYDPDSDVEVVASYSIGRFYRKCKSYLEDDPTKFVKFTLCGMDAEGPFVMDPMRERMKASESFIVTRDYDSLLGIHEHIFATSYVTIHTLARNEDSLSANVHLKYEFTSSRVSKHSFFF